MLIHLADIPEDGLDLVIEEPPSALSLEGDPFLTSAAPIVCKLRVSLFGDELVVQGELSTVLHAACSRCTREFDSPVLVRKFVYSAEVSDETESVDLTPEVRESILLSFPAYPVCVSGCKGLCPHCGKDLNDGMCQCAAPPADDRWSALDVLGEIKPQEGKKDGST